jgi:hypothetical protein
VLPWICRWAAGLGFSRTDKEWTESDVRDPFASGRAVGDALIIHIIHEIEQTSLQSSLCSVVDLGWRQQVAVDQCGCEHVSSEQLPVYRHEHPLPRRRTTGQRANAHSGEHETQHVIVVVGALGRRLP